MSEISAVRSVLARRNCVVIDTESARSTAEVGGWMPAMGVSALGMFDYVHHDDLFGLRFATEPLDVAEQLARRPALWVGYSISRYDLAVMCEAGYVELTSDERTSYEAARDRGDDCRAISPRIRTWLARRDVRVLDLIDVGEALVGHRPRLDGFLRGLGLGKTDAGAEAPRWAREGRWGRMMTYLGADVRGTLMLFEALLTRDRLRYWSARDERWVQIRVEGTAWESMRAEILVPPRAVQQDLGLKTEPRRRRR